MESSSRSQEYVTREAASEIALAAAKESARQVIGETFALLGVNVANFESMDKFRQDLVWVRTTRELTTGAGKKAVATAITLATGSFLIGVFDLLKDMIKR